MQATAKTTENTSRRVDYEAGTNGISAMPPVQRMGEGEAASSVESSVTPNHTGLPDSMKSNLENASGFDMSDIRVHRNDPSPAKVGALAYTQGTDIYLGPGQEKHLGHEAWHSVQYKQGRVQANTSFKSAEGDAVAGNDQAHLETEADVIGAKLSGSSVIAPTSGQQTVQQKAGATVQRKPVIQRIQSMVEFQEATARGWNKPRKKMGELDKLIASYHGAHSADKMEILQEIEGNANDYLTTRPGGGRRTGVQGLLTETQAELVKRRTAIPGLFDEALSETYSFIVRNAFQTFKRTPEGSRYEGYQAEAFREIFESDENFRASLLAYAKSRHDEENILFAIAVLESGYDSLISQMEIFNQFVSNHAFIPTNLGYDIRKDVYKALGITWSSAG